LVLAALPSGLLVAVTASLSNDISPVPLIWITPLALYLVTFVMAFTGRTPRLLLLARWALPAAVVVQAFLMFGARTSATGLLVPAGMEAIDPPFVVLAGIRLVTFLLAAYVCHSDLAASRPVPADLTRFYLWISFGGVLGGAFSALLAPVVFRSLIEYPLALVLCCLVSGPEMLAMNRRRRLLDVAWPIGVAAITVGVLIVWIEGPPAWRYGLPLVACLSAIGGRLRFAASMAAVFAVGGWFNESRCLVVARERNFFGVLQVTRTPSGDGFSLFHGGVKHGSQFHSGDALKRRLPLSYYFPTGPIGQVCGEFQREKPTGRVAVIGLGVGALAGYATAQQTWAFFEVNPAVVRLATDPQFFTYVRDCPAMHTTVVGDARLSLAQQTGELYDLIVVDAFSGDAPPVHLLTREALNLYLDRLDDDGLIAFHITNNWLDLEPVVAALAADCQPPLFALARNEPDATIDARERAWGKTGSRWAVIARRAEVLIGLKQEQGWRAATTRSTVRAWSDDYSNLLAVLKWR
jgi:hypothetical protein